MSHFYKDSLDLLRRVKDSDPFLWICLRSYVESPNINSLMHKIEYEWDTGIPVKGYVDPYTLLFNPLQDPILRSIEGLSYRQVLRRYMTSIQSLILDQMPVLAEELVLWRGYVPVGKGLAAHPSDYTEGQEVTNWSFLSCSLEQVMAVKFSDGPCCMMRITVPAGGSAVQITGGRNQEWVPGLRHRQSEVLLPAGTTLRIDRVGKDEVVYATVIGRRPVRL